ncbi:MAG: site-2 protease family protein [Anaerolineales bacterium]|nr:MAG: site-2 protease family protein [Anaerolineales bacterium]
MTTVLAAVAVLGLLMFVHELGHLIFAKLAGFQVEEFGIGYPPRLLTLARRGGTEYTLNLILFGAFVRMAEGEEPGTLSPDRSRSARAGFLVGGPLLNVLLSVLLFSLCFASGWPVAYDRGVGVSRVRPRSVAEAVGFREDDLILSADDHKVSSLLDLIVYARSVDGHVKKVTILRRGLITELPLPAGGAWFVDTQTRGVQIRDDAGSVEIVSYPWPEALKRGVTEALVSVGALFALAVRILRGLIPVDIVRPVGPVGIAQVTGQAARQVASSGWWFPLLQLTAALSAALAATNLLPLPGLDGGRLLFVAVEALRGKRLDPRKENFVHFVGIVFMLVVILIVTYYDITVPYPFAGR